MGAKGGWELLKPKNDGPLGRSSHSVVYFEDNLFVFGGENIPRHPIDSEVWAFDLKDSSWRILPTVGEKPSARVGHVAAVVSGKMFIFGGRLGVSQESKNANIRFTSIGTSLNDLWALDLRSFQWERIQPHGHEVPSERSYHSGCGSDSAFFVFGGCGTQGRLNDLWRFDISSSSWSLLTGKGPAPSPRGGPAFAYLEKKLFIFGGFNGKELGDFFVFDCTANEWKEISHENSKNLPTRRSVALMTPLGSTALLLFGGEADPSDLGHEGAGSYFGDTWKMDLSTLTWNQVDKGGEVDGIPTARGWLSGSSCGNGKVAIFGGFDGTERRGDLFVWAE